jgi:HK97 family phage major capsid protein
MTDTDIDAMTLEQTRAAAQELLDNTTGDLAGTDAQRFQALTRRAEQIREHEQQRATATRDMVQQLASGEMRTEGEGHSLPGYGRRDDNRDEDRTPGAQQRDGAMRVLDRAVKDERLAARGAELVEDLMRTGTPLSQSWTQRYTVAAGAPAYESAFAKLVANPERGHLEWTEAEAEAYRAVRAVQAEQRAMSTTDNAGGYMIPLTLDPAVMLTSNGSINPLRQIARVVQTVTDTWQGVTSAGVTAEWVAESTEVADASPTLGSPSIPVYKGDAFVPFSFEVQGDAVNFMQELGQLLVDGAEQLNATAYTTGSGSGQPKGVITAVAAVGGSVVSPATPETLASADVYSTQNALGPRFQPNAQWCANLAIINNLRQFETTNGALKFPALQENPPMLLGRPMNELSNMDGSINAAATENNYVLLYGDFARGFVIVDRIGSTLELVPHLFGSNRRPTGQRGALLWFRTGSDAVIPNAFRLLSIPTTA